MTSVTLEKYLLLPPYESCGKGIVRPVDVMNGNVVFSCSNRQGCFFSAFATLPPLSKKVIYLDTSIVSHMARAKARGDASAPYVKLYEALRRATARNLADDSDVAELSERISESIWQGGFHQDFAAHMMATMPEAFRKHETAEE